MCTGSVERLLLAVGGGDDGDDGEDLSRAYRQLAEECAAAVSRGGYPDGPAEGTSLADSH